MAKLLALTLAFAALVAFATAHTTIVTTTIDGDENPISRQRQCSQQIQQQRLNQCRRYLQQSDQSPYEDNRRRQGQQQQQQSLQQCCQELQNIDEQCQCEAIKQVFRQAQQQQQERQTGPFSAQQTRQLRQKAQMLPNQCNLQTRQCQIGSVMTTITTTIDENENDDIDNPSRPPYGRRGSRSGSQQCSQSEIQRSVDQCQRYVQQQIRSPWETIMMSTNRRGQEQQGELRECCNELQNLRRECQCDAVEEIARRVMRQQQQQQGGGRQQQQRGGRRGGQQQETTEIVRRLVQNLPNQCSLEVQQCSIPY